jgi:hypothetical protein
MNVDLFRKLLLLVVGVSVISINGSSYLMAAKDAPAAAPAADPKAKAVAKDETPGGRLPPYYKGLVDDTQRAKIYAIQAEHDPGIKQLQASVKAATAKRDAAVLAVLTPAQQEKLAKLQAEAKTKKSGDDNMDAKAAAAPAAATPAATAPAVPATPAAAPATPVKAKPAK